MVLSWFHRFLCCVLGDKWELVKNGVGEARHLRMYGMS